MTPSDIKKALSNPLSFFDQPCDVLNAEDLTNHEKISILKRWELDARSLQRATDEGMSGGTRPPLDAINDALAELDPDNTVSDNFGNTPTKI